MATQAAPGNGGTEGESGSPAEDRVRFAVVGLGHIAQVTVLPAFAHSPNSELCALVSSDRTKLLELGRHYGVNRLCSYDDFDALLGSGEIDAVYIALPNHLHAEFAIRAAQAGIHVLCEKPMAVDESECRSMIRAAEDNGVELMVAYRLHFDRANLEAVDLVTRGALGEVRLFDSVFSQCVKEGDVRLMPRNKGGGPLFDMGIYCINAARYIFRAEPTTVSAVAVRPANDSRFRHCEESLSAILQFPGDRLATFTTSFGTEGVSTYRVVGTDGELTMSPAYEYAVPLEYRLHTPFFDKKATFARRDQFAPELTHFSSSVIEGRRVEPDGYEGLADVQIIRALYESAESGRSVRIQPVKRGRRPTLSQAQDIPEVGSVPEVHVAGPSAR